MGSTRGIIVELGQLTSSRCNRLAFSLRRSRWCSAYWRPPERVVGRRAWTFPLSFLLFQSIRPCPKSSCFIFFPRTLWFSVSSSTSRFSLMALFVCRGVSLLFVASLCLQSTSLAGAFRNDGANGTLPVLNPAELHQLQVPTYLMLEGRRTGTARLRGGGPGTEGKSVPRSSHAVSPTGLPVCLPDGLSCAVPAVSLLVGFHFELWGGSTSAIEGSEVSCWR